MCEHADPLSPGDALCHPALVYTSTDAFLAATVPFVRAGLAAGEPVLAVTGARNLAALAEALGDDAQHVDLRRADDWLVNPWRALPRYRRYVELHGTGGGRVRVIGEPFALSRSAPAAVEWTRCESLLNDAFADLRLTSLCPYDAATLAPQVIAQARRTHPMLLSHDGRLLPNPDYVDARALSATLDAVALAPPPHGPLAQCTLDAAFGDLRRFVGEQARACGLDREQAADIAFAVHEVAVNAHEHGGGDGTLRTWTDDDAFVCEVADHGAGMRDPLAGTVEPGAAQPHGRGLWLARQLCDLVQVRSGATGTVVRLHMALVL